MYGALRVREPLDLDLLDRDLLLDKDLLVADLLLDEDLLVVDLLSDSDLALDNGLPVVDLALDLFLDKVLLVSESSRKLFSLQTPCDLVLPDDLALSDDLALGGDSVGSCFTTGGVGSDAFAVGGRTWLVTEVGADLGLGGGALLGVRARSLLRDRSCTQTSTGAGSSSETS